MMRSPASIMPKSAIALPASARTCACKRCRVRDSFKVSGSGGGAARRRIKVFVLRVAHEGDRGEGLAGGGFHELLHRHLGAERVDMRAQPGEEAREVPARKLRIKLRNIPAQGLVQL